VGSQSATQGEAAYECLRFEMYAPKGVKDGCANRLPVTFAGRRNLRGWRIASFRYAAIAIKIQPAHCRTQ